MKVLLTAIFLSTIGFAVANYDVENAFDEAELTPDILETAPTELLEIQYGDKIVILGNELTPNETTDMPEIHYNGQCSAFYTLIMTDADAGLPPNRDFLHWLVGNIPGDNVSIGELLAVYRKPSPPLGTGLHRYVFLVYKQNQGPISFEEEPILSVEQLTERGEFSIEQFTEKYNLGDPLFGNFVTIQGQPSCS